MQESVGVPLMVISRHDDQVTAVNNVLRAAGHPVHCTQISQLNELEEALQSRRPELILLFDGGEHTDLAMVARQVARLEPNPPLLVVQTQVSEQSIANAMECGARDVISLTHKNRFVAVVDRELAAFRLQVALSGVLSSANQYQNELHTLMRGSGEAIADVQEGIIVSANPAWTNLFGYDGEEELISVPFMDVFANGDQPILKGALVACLRDKWDEETLNITGFRADRSELNVDINLERVTIEGDPAVRVTVPTEQAQPDSPADLLEQAVFKDPSTGFYHRHYFIEKIEERIQAPLDGGVRAIAYLRPDHFARVHDDIGLLATESLLTRLAGVLKDFMQPRDIYGRFGGTMFVALLERGTMVDVEMWAEKLRKSIAEKVFEVEDQSTSLTCTIGLAEIDIELNTSETLAQVELACRTAREAGGNRVQMTENTNATQMMRASDALWVPRLRTALMQNRLRLVHQPITGLNEEVEGMHDTRVQMLDEDGEVILASDFIPAAERANMIKNVDRWVVGASFSFCASKNPYIVFVRLSADSVLDQSLPDWLTARLQGARVDAGQICFQVSEEVAAQHLKQTKYIAEKLRSMGFKFAIDHLGNGRDSDQVLNHVPMDYVKIDGSLMQGLHRSHEAQSTVGELVKTARELKIKTIAERVEDANTMAILWQLSVAFIQGNHVQMQGVVLEDTLSIQTTAL